MVLSNILTFIENFIRKQSLLFEDDKFNPDETWEAMGLDSLDEVELIMQLESQMGIGIPDASIEFVKSPRELATLIESNYETYKI